MDGRRWTVYLLRCNDDSLYCGVTTDIERRVKEHQNGTGSRYTAARGPVTLVHTEGSFTHSEALQREYTIKQLSKCEKERLVQTS